MSVENVIDFLELCLDATYFIFLGVFYQQSVGTAMDSPVSVIVPNLVMEEMEQKAHSEAFWTNQRILFHQQLRFVCYIDSPM